MGGLATQNGVANNHITNSRLADMPAKTLKGNDGTASGDPRDLTPAEAKALLAIDAADVSGLSAVTWTQEQLEDLVASMFQRGTQSGVAVAYDDATGAISLTASVGGPSLTEEEVEDFVGGLVVQGTGISVVYDDAGNALSISLSGESYTTADRNKLAGIAAGATANSTDAQLRDRSTHTGTQAISTVSGLQTALDGKASSTHTHSWTEVTGKPTVFPPSAHGHAWTELTGVPQLPSYTSAPTPPASGVSLYSRRRAGMEMLDFMRPNGRDISVQAHLGLNRIHLWNPQRRQEVNTMGLSRASVGTVSHPGLENTNLSTSCRRWRVTSAATAASWSSCYMQESICWRGNAPGLGGFTLIQRLSMAVLPTVDGSGFWGLQRSTVAPSGAFDLVTSSMTDVLGIGFRVGVHANWQIIYNSGASTTKTFVDTGIPVNDLTAVLTVYVYSPQNGSSIFFRVVNEATGTVFEHEATTNIPPNNVFLNLRNMLTNGTEALAVAYDCFGVYLETDY